MDILKGFSKGLARKKALVIVVRSWFWGAEAGIFAGTGTSWQLPWNHQG